MSNTDADTFRLTKKGQVTIPKAVRDAIGLRPGDSVVFDIENDTVVLRKAFDREAYEAAIERVSGTADLNGMTTDELMQLMRSYDFVPPKRDGADAA